MDTMGYLMIVRHQDLKHHETVESSISNSKSESVQFRVGILQFRIKAKLYLFFKPKLNFWKLASQGLSFWHLCIWI